MAKNAVTDWSPTDSLNTDIGSTNIAEGCAPGGINDAIRKLMAQIATYITDALHMIVRVGDSAFKLWLNGASPRIEFDTNDYLAFDRTANSLGVFIGGAACHTVSATAASFAVSTTTLQDSQLPRLDFNRTGTAIWHVGGSGTAGDNSFNIILNASAPGLSVGTGYALSSPGSAAFTGGISSSGVIRASGTSLAGLNSAAAVELFHDGTAGTVQAYNRGTSAYSTISVAGSNVNLQPQGGAVVSAGNHVIQGVATVQNVAILGGSALGGISGQVRFDRADGAANVLNISLATGNTFLFNDSDSSGAYSFRLANIERLRITNSLVSSPVPLQAGITGGGAIRISQGDIGTSGAINLLDAAGSSLGYISQAFGGDINYVNELGAGHFFLGNYLTMRKSSIAGISLAVGTASVTGRLIMTDAVGGTSAYIGGQTIGQATVYSNANGHFFDSYLSATGLVEGVTPGAGSSGGLRARGSTAGGAAILQFTDRNATNEWVSFIADPSGSKIIVNVGHTPVFSIDSGGNVRALGSITPNVTP